MYLLKITSAVVIDGEIKNEGSEVRVDASLARLLLNAGKAEPLDDPEQPIDPATVGDEAAPADVPAAAPKKGKK